MLSKWGLPSIPDLLSNLKQLINTDAAASRAYSALKTGTFVDADGRRDKKCAGMNPLRQIALMCWLVQQSRTPLSVEVGFGMGTTATFLLAARRTAGHDFQHVVLDPFGLGDGAGDVVQEYLNGQFGDQFSREYVTSAAGLSSIHQSQGMHVADFILLDGDHRYDGVLSDFHSASKIVDIGGYIILDDAAFPGVESLVRFVETNRPDFEVSWLDIPNTAVLKKVAADRREWTHFVPFQVSDRRDWTVHPDAEFDWAEDWEFLDS